MMGYPVIGSARRVARSTVVRRLAETDMERRAKDRAARIVEEAQAEAARIREAAETERQSGIAQISHIADAELDTFIDRERFERETDAALSLMRASRQVREDFEAMEGWLAGLVAHSVRRVLGALPAEDIWAAILSDELRHVSDRWNLTLHCAVEDYETFAAVLANAAPLSKAVAEIKPDAGLPQGSCHIVSASGVLDISLATRLDAMTRALEQAAEAGQ